MSAKSVILALPLENSIKISKWKVKEGTIVSVGRVILLYDVNPGNGQPEIQKLKCTAVGTVRKLLAREGDVVHPGGPLLQLEKCTHPTVMKDMCAECGADLRNEETASHENSASIPMVHSIPELKVNAEQAQILGKADEERLLASRKLVLLVDLDQTLIHTTNDNIPPTLKDVYHFRLHGSLSPWHHTRLRPGTKQFLKEMSKFYELHICTFGSRMYAHMIAMFLDPDGQYFSHRILSRDECFSANSKTANLKALFPCGDNMVCIIDDREDVWNFAPNLIHVKPYHFFQHTGDINAPPGLAKRENDDAGEYDFSCLGDGKRPLKESVNCTIKKSTGKELAVTMPQSSSEEGEVDRKNQASRLENLNKGLVIEGSSSEGQLNPGEEMVAEESDQKPVVTKGNTSEGHLNPSEEIVAEESDQKPVVTKGNTSEGQLNPNEEIVTEESDQKPVSNCDSKIISVRFEELEADLNEAGEGSLHQGETKECARNTAGESSSEEATCEEVSVKASKDALCSGSLMEQGASEREVCDEKEHHGATIVTDSSALAHEDETFNKEDSSLLKSKASKTTVNVNKQTKSKERVREIEVEDGDDYLMYLEEILRRIHQEFYQRLEIGQKPDMKEVVPAVRKQVLAGTSLVFSGLVPNNIPLERSRAYQVAVSLGASVTQDLNEHTTHLVAVRPGTLKVRSARDMKGLFMVTADWLWTCAERWERVDEKVFPLGRNRAGTRHPPAHCGSPEHTPIASESQPDPTTSTGRNRTASGRFMDTINPLLSFSSADIADMDQEIDDILNESESDGEGDGNPKKQKIPVEMEAETGSDADSQPAGPHSILLTDKRLSVKRGNEALDDSESSSSSADSLSGEHPHGWEKHDLKRKHPGCAPGTGTATESDGEDEADDMPSAKFRRGEALPSDLDMGDNDSESHGSEEPPDEMDDGDWNMMGAALEREFLS